MQTVSLSCLFLLFSSLSNIIFQNDCVHKQSRNISKPSNRIKPDRTLQYTKKDGTYNPPLPSSYAPLPIWSVPPRVSVPRPDLSRPLSPWQSWRPYLAASSSYLSPSAFRGVFVSSVVILYSGLPVLFAILRRELWLWQTWLCQCLW